MEVKLHSCYTSKQMEIKFRSLRLLIPWSKVLLEKLIFAQLAKKFSEFYRVQRFITVFTKAGDWSLS
jgi:hypothetical protein